MHTIENRLLPSTFKVWIAPHLKSFFAIPWWCNTVVWWHNCLKGNTGISYSLLPVRRQDVAKACMQNLSSRWTLMLLSFHHNMSFIYEQVWSNFFFWEDWSKLSHARTVSLSPFLRAQISDTITTYMQLILLQSDVIISWTQCTKTVTDLWHWLTDVQYLQC